MLLGLTGRAGSGKDTVADFLVENHDFTRLAFADALRDACLALDPFVRPVQGGGWDRLSNVIEKYGWDYSKRSFPEVRRLLQVMGTEVGRQILGENCWVDIVSKKIEPGKNYVLTDVRFENEVAFVREQQGWIVEVHRPNNPNAIPATHASEQLSVLPNFILHNDRTIRELQQQTSALVGFVRYNVSTTKVAA